MATDVAKVDRLEDAIALTDELICLNSTKPTLRSADVDRFVEEIAVFCELFPEYAGLRLVGILAAGDQPMEVKNRPDFEPKRW